MKSFLILSALLMAGVMAWANWPTKALPPGTVADRILVEKSQRTLTLFSGTTALRRYVVALGSVKGSKDREGDRKTPEGFYHIVEHKPSSAFHRALRISYPEEKDRIRAQTLGVAPGSNIMIHGLRNGLGLVGRCHRLLDWTAGCIAVTNPEIEEISAAVADGTPVEIRP